MTGTDEQIASLDALLAKAVAVRAASKASHQMKMVLTRSMNAAESASDKLRFAMSKVSGAYLRGDYEAIVKHATEANGHAMAMQTASQQIEQLMPIVEAVQ